MQLDLSRIPGIPHIFFMYHNYITKKTLTAVISSINFVKFSIVNVSR